MDAGFVVLLLTGPAVMVLITVISWMAGTGRIKRNNTMGLRLPSLLSSDAAWERGHRAVVRPALVSAIALLLLGVVALLLRSSGTLEPALTAVTLVLMLVAIVLVAVLGSRAARAGDSAP